MIMNKTNIGSIIREYSLFIVLIGLITVFSLSTDNFLSLYNIINILKRVSVTGIISLGTLFVIITGGIDVSVGAVVALASIITASYSQTSNSVFGLLLILIMTAALIGLLIGTIVAKGKVPPIITTLAFMSIIRGGMMIYTKGFTIDNAPNKLLEAIGRGKVGPIPVLVLILIGAFIISGIILKRTRFGRYIYAIGGSEEICRYAGIKVDTVKICVYLFAAAMSVLAGVVMCARLKVGQPTAAMGIELDCIAAVVLGGASLSGGRGTVLNTFLGVLILGLLINGLNYLNVVTYWQYVLQGAVILASTLIYSKRN